MDAIIDETAAAADADRAAWRLDMRNRGEPTAPTVRQREVETRGAGGPIGDGRCRKSPLAVTACAREPAEPPPPPNRRKGTKGEHEKKARSHRSPQPARASVRGSMPSDPSAPKPDPQPREVPPAQLSGPPAESEAPRRSEHRPVPFEGFTCELDGRDDHKVHVSPDRRTVVLRSDHAWWVLHRTTDGIWQLGAGPLAVGPLRPTPAVELSALDSQIDDDIRGAVDRLAELARAERREAEQASVGALAVAGDSLIDLDDDEALY